METRDASSLKYLNFERLNVFRFVLFMFFLPAVQAVLFCVAIGGNPTLLPLGVINNEVPDPANCIVSPGCSISNMSCNFIKQIPAETISLVILSLYLPQ